MLGSEPWAYSMALVYSSSNLHLKEFNRIIKNTMPLLPSDEQILKHLQKNYECQKLEPDSEIKPKSKGEIGLILVRSNSRYILIRKCVMKRTISGVRSLDVSILSNEILKPLFSIEDSKSDSYIEFIKGTEDARLNPESHIAAFFVAPVEVADIYYMVEQGRSKMPPHATFFYPKPLSGFVIHSFS